jgi:hypothetical protein
MSEIINKIYGYDNSRVRKTLKKYIEDNNIDISHLSSQPRKYQIITKECPVCGTEFKDKLGHVRKKTTCSYSCSNTYFRSGINNPNFGKNISNSDYSYRTICFTYPGKMCIICGENKIVAVHHYDENHNNNDPENLVPLCPTHHQYVHSRYKNEVIDKINEFVYTFKTGRVL